MIKRYLILTLLFIPFIVCSQKTTIKVSKVEDTFLKGIWVDLLKSKCNCTIFYDTTNEIVIRDSLNNDVTEFYDVKISLPHYIRDYAYEIEIGSNEYEVVKQIILVDETPPELIVESKFKKGSIKTKIKTDDYPVHKVRINECNCDELRVDELPKIDSIKVDLGDVDLETKIRSFDVRIGDEVFKSTSNKFTNEMKDKLLQLASGDEVILMNVKYGNTSRNRNVSFQIDKAVFYIR